jgi:hypothetical protein
MTNFFGDLQGPSSEPFTSVPQPLELYLESPAPLVCKNNWLKDLFF